MGHYLLFWQLKQCILKVKYTMLSLETNRWYFEKEQVKQHKYITIKNTSKVPSTFNTNMYECVFLFLYLLVWLYLFIFLLVWVQKLFSWNQFSQQAARFFTKSQGFLEIKLRNLQILDEPNLAGLLHQAKDLFLEYPDV